MNQPSPILKNAADEHSLRSLILKKAQSIGPSVTSIVESIWVRAVMTALYDIERFLKLADAHSPTRLETASKRAIFHGHGDHRTVDYILMKHLDSLPLSHYTDIDGQLLFWPKNEHVSK